MSNNTGTYVLGTSDGYRICWGSHLEKLDPPAIKAFSLSPAFKNYAEALGFASLVEKANNTEFGILVLNYVDFDFVDLLEKRKDK